MKKGKNYPLTRFSLKTVWLLCMLFCGLNGSLLAQTGPGKETVLTLNPGNDNPRNSEGDFVTLKDGRIMFVYSHYTGTSSSDHASAYLAARYSADGGKTWTKSDKVIVEKEGTMNVMSVSLLRLKNGKIALFYLKKNSTSDCIPMVRFSSDEAKTWTEPIACITDRKGYFVLNNSRVIQLKSGRILLAVALHQTPEQANWSNSGSLWSYYSDDNGKTWKPGQQVANPDQVVTQEPGVVELKNGNVLMFIRTDAGVQYFSYSKDKGQSWSPAAPSTIKSPVSPASIKRIPSTGDLILIWNNNGGDNPLIKGKRTPLNAAISKDEGKTWQNVKTVEDDPNGWYCYIAIHFSGKHVLLSYCSGVQPRFSHLTVTDIKRLNLDWVYGK
ncbi:sialidase family protein [Pedobacter heparinus]|uniref:sialidase family protein n=1 Tax=Pedobacter heparinus TaxID=984 RepID=UPI00292CD1C8|nr:sialidase family protein [Pedobacter heparinus]